MNNPMTIWCLTAAVLLVTFLLRALTHRHHAIHDSHSHRHLFETGRERDIFFVPGDCDDDDDD